jgi:hypothetical protein
MYARDTRTCKHTCTHGMHAYTQTTHTRTHARAHTHARATHAHARAHTHTRVRARAVAHAHMGARCVYSGAYAGHFTGLRPTGRYAKRDFGGLGELGDVFTGSTN